jgi:hypothetical protein
MDQELASHIEFAANISVSGRWAALNDRIKQCAQTTAVAENWHFIFFTSLCFAVFSEHLQLEKAYSASERRNESLLAWRARNLLELAVWAIYFCTNEENARRLYEDAGRDALDLVSAFEKWGKSTQAPDWFQTLQDTKETLRQDAANVGIQAPEGAYKRIDIAAQECGIGKHFAAENKFLSKFAHPTAMQILASADAIRNNLQRDVFFSHGCMHFCGAFTCLETHLSRRDTTWTIIKD